MRGYCVDARPLLRHPPFGRSRSNGQALSAAMLSTRPSFVRTSAQHRANGNAEDSGQKKFRLRRFFPPAASALR